MQDPKDFINRILANQGPVVQETLALIKDPKTPIRDKVKLLSTLALPELKKVKSQPQVMMMMPMLVTMAIAQGKEQFQQLPKEVVVGMIDAELAKLPQKEILEMLVVAELAEIKAKKEAAESTPDAAAEQTKVQAYIKDIFVELGEDKYAALSKGLATIIPAALTRTFENLDNDPDFDKDSVLKTAFADLAANKKLKKNATSVAIETFMESDELVDYGVNVVANLSGEKVYGMIEKIVNELDEASIVSLAQNALGMAEDLLVAGKTTGNPLLVANSKASAAFAKALGQQTQLIEDAVLESGILPQTDLRPVLIGYKAKADAAAKTPKP